MLELGKQRRRQGCSRDRKVGADRAHHLRRRALVALRSRAAGECCGADRELGGLGEDLLEPLGREPLDRAQQRPLVARRLRRLRVEEDARSGRPASALQRQRDQVPEPLLRQEVLIREEPVVAREVELRPPGHRLPEQQRPQPPRRPGSDRRREEDPHVRALARAAPLQRGRHLMLSARLEQSERIELPRPAVEVAGEKPAGVVLEQRIDADRLTPAKMPHDRLVGQRQVCLRLSLRPTACRRGHIAALARARVLPAQRIDIVATPEQAPNQRDLLVRGSTGIKKQTRRMSFAVTGADDRSRALREREQRAQPFVLRAQALQLAQGLVEPVLNVASRHGRDRRGL
jgi:hypothetical protein